MRQKRLNGLSKEKDNVIHHPWMLALVSVLVLPAAAAQVHAESPYQVAWIHQLGSSSYDDGSSISADLSGGLYVTGDVYGYLASPSAGKYDAFVAKYDLAGNKQWVRQLGTSGHDIGESISSDGARQCLCRRPLRRARWVDGHLAILMRIFSNSTPRGMLLGVGNSERRLSITGSSQQTHWATFG